MQSQFDFVYVWLWGPAVYLAFLLTFYYSFKSLFNNIKTFHENAYAGIAFIFLTLGICLQCLHAITLFESLGSSLIILAWCVLLLSFIMKIKISTPLINVMIVPLCIILVTIGLRYGETGLIEKSHLTRKIHIFLTLLGMTTTLLASVTSIIFFIHNLKLKRKIKTNITLPSLDTTKQLISAFDITACLLLTGAILTGALYAKQLYGRGWSSQMPWIFFFTLTTWGILLTIVIMNWKDLLTGKKLALYNLLLFFFVMLILFGGH